MKFTKEQAVEKLNHELTNNGKKPLRMSARTLESQVETLLTFITDEDMELDAFVEKVKASLENINSNMEKDQSDFVKDYQKNHPAPPKKKAKGDEGDDSDPDDPLAEIRKKLEDLERKEQEREASNAIAAKKAEIKKYLKENNVKNEEWIESALSMFSVGSEDDAEEKGKTLLAFYNKSFEGTPLNPSTPKPGEGIDPADTFGDVKNILKRRNGQTEESK